MTGKSGLSHGPELLSPAGNLDSAYYAFSAGADGVYFGLQKFSARASARNFSFDDARRLRAHSKGLGKKIYATINTLITPGEWKELDECARFLDYLEVDGVILQDWGVSWYLSHNFPGLQRHSSTQMAIHNWQGACFAAEQGIKRIVLAREMTKEEISQCMEKSFQRFPDLEFEVFIHGAQCYGFSGLCLASGLQLGRSANRGECGQICRTWFEDSSARPSGDQSSKVPDNVPRFYFSANDKSLAYHIGQAVHLGIHSFKVEGRMKSPTYVRETIGMYRHLIDQVLEGKNPVPHRDTLFRVQSAHSRTWTPGFWDNPKGQTMINPQFPGATGFFLGKVKQVQGRAFRLETAHSLFPRDGVFLHIGGKYQNPSQDNTYPIQKQSREANRWDHGGIVKITPHKDKGSLWIEVQKHGTPLIPIPGSPVHLVSRHDGQLPALNPGSLPLYYPSITLTIRIEPEGLHISCPWLSRTYPISWEPSNNATGLVSQLQKVFSVKGEFFSFVPVTKETQGSYFFAPASLLKSIRRTWVKDSEQAYWNKSLDYPELPKARSLTALFSLPPRHKLQVQKLPFYFPGDPVEPWISLAGKEKWIAVWIPLFPIELGLPDWTGLNEFLYQKDRAPVVLGIGNSSALYRYLKDWSIIDGVFAFLDYGMYSANPWAVNFFCSTIKGIQAMVPWIENAPWIMSEDQLPMDVRGFRPPHFLSRVCSRRIEQGNSCTGCPHLKGLSTEVWNKDVFQQEKHYRIQSYRCWNIVDMPQA